MTIRFRQSDGDLAKVDKLHQTILYFAKDKFSAEGFTGDTLAANLNYQIASRQEIDTAVLYLVATNKLKFVKTKTEHRSEVRYYHSSIEVTCG